jgi:hypothetical protein
MPMLALMRSVRGPSPLSLVATVLVVSGLFAMMRSRISSTQDNDPGSEACDETYDPSCASQLNGGSA